ncbi:MAG: hypothetical protein QM778_21725 [Myxococcales bacterium]
MRKVVVAISTLLAVAAVAFFANSRQPVDLAPGQAAVSTPEAASTAKPDQAAATTPAPQKASLQAALAKAVEASKHGGPAVSESEEGVLKMYDEIATALSDEQKDCDVLGTALGGSVDAHARDLNRWAQTQKGLSAAELAANNERLLKAAGDRMQRAQDAIRRAMGKCIQSEKFQDALRDLSELGTPG